jgi:peptidoglycan LD-endopeptidase LytH
VLPALPVRRRAALLRGMRWAAAAALAAGCGPGEPPADRTTYTIEINQPPASADAAGQVAAPPVATDSATPAAGQPVIAVVPPPPDPAGRDQTAIAPTADTPAGAPATAQELAELSARLAVPVHGVPRSALRDSYDESRGERQHEALDIHAPHGTPVLAAADGRVLRLFDSTPGGLMVYSTDASGRFILFYGHLAGYADGLRDGMAIRQGQVIGYVGTTGNAAANAPHLHFGILRGDPAASWSSGVPTNPYPLLTGGLR